MRLERQNSRKMFQIVAAMVLLAADGYCQQGPRCPTCPIVIPGRPLDNKDLNDMRRMNERKRDFEAANALRKEAIDDEALKLLILARDLKQKTENVSPQPLPAVLEKEAAIIEFLANDLKEKMKLTVNPD